MQRFDSSHCLFQMGNSKRSELREYLRSTSAVELGKPLVNSLGGFNAGTASILGVWPTGDEA